MDTADTDGTDALSSSFPTKNEALAAVKSIGWARYDAMTRQIIAKTRKPLLEFDDEETPDQYRDANLMLQEATLALDHLVKKGDSTFTIRGDPIHFVDCDINKNHRQAKIHWCLPLPLLDSDIPDHITQRLRDKMQMLLERNGHRIQTIVFSRLRAYYAPKIRFVPSLSNPFDEIVRRR